MSGLKNHGFSQEMNSVSATAKELVGTMRVMRDGRKFKYCKNGSGALTAGLLVQMVAMAANVSHQASPAAVAIGSNTLAFTAGGNVTYAENFFAGGFVVIDDGVGAGAQYEIESSTAVTAGTAINLMLKKPIIGTALTTGSYLSLVHNPCMEVATNANEENFPVGVAICAVPASNYFWAQVAGVTSVLVDGTVAVFVMVVPGSVAGSVKTIPDWGAATVTNMPVIGQAIRAGVDTKYTQVNLNIM